MSATAAAYGLDIISDQGGFAPRRLCLKNGIASGLASNIFLGQPVMLNTTLGTITPCTATTDKIFGVFAGCEYTPVGQRPAISPFWPASATYTAGLDIMNAYIWPAWIPGYRFRLQADGAVAQALYGSGFNLSNFSTGSTVTGLSGCTAAAAGVAASSQAQVTLIEFGEDINSAVNDAFTDLIVSIAYPQVVAGYQTSAG